MRATAESSNPTFLFGLSAPILFYLPSFYLFPLESQLPLTFSSITVDIVSYSLSLSVNIVNFFVSRALMNSFTHAQFILSSRSDSTHVPQRSNKKSPLFDSRLNRPANPLMRHYCRSLLPTRIISLRYIDMANELPTSSNAQTAYFLRMTPPGDDAALSPRATANGYFALRICLYQICL